MIYGYARISTNKQDISHQIRNTIAFDKHIKIYQEAFVGTKTTTQEEFQKLLHKVCAGDTIAFNSVSHMSCNASEGCIQVGAVEQSVVSYDKLSKAVKAIMELVNTVRETAGFPRG